MMPKIGMVCYFDPDTYPGVYNSCNILAEQGWSVDVVCLEQYGFGGKIFDSRVWLHRIENRPSGRKQGGSVRFAKLICKARVVGRERKWDIGIGHDMHGFAAARLSKVLPPSRIAFWSQDLSDPNQMSIGQRLIYLLKKRFLPDCPLIIAPSLMRAEALERFFKLGAKPQVVYNSPRLKVDMPYEGWRKRLSIAVDVPVVVYAGGFGRDRRIPELISSVAFWHKPSVLLLAGHGHPQIVHELQKMVFRSGTTDRVFWVGHLPSIFGLVREAQVGISLFVNKNHRDSKFMGMASNKIFEYLAMGKPAVVIENTETAAFMEKYRCGVCVKDPSPEGIANEINQFLQEPNFLAETSLRARETHLNETHFERRFEPVIEQLTNLGN
jgi:glycosyltransferase involved in cell wall biosynthesis